MGKWDFLAPYDAQVQGALTAGDAKQAFEVLLQGYQGVVVQFCTALLGNAADGEDAAQEVFEAILVGSKNSCGLTLIIFQQSSQPFATLNGAFTFWILTDCKKEEHVAFAQFIAVCRRSKMVSMSTRRPRKGLRLCKR